MLYTIVVGLGLYTFFLHHLCTLALNNKTTNEHLRNRWNGDPHN